MVSCKNLSHIREQTSAVVHKNTRGDNDSSMQNAIFAIVAELAPSANSSYFFTCAENRGIFQPQVLSFNIMFL
jgi:hypothetical protein